MLINKNAVALDDETLMLIEALYNKDAVQLKRAIRYGAKINRIIDHHQFTPLHHAVLLNFYDGVRLLIKAGANTTAKTARDTGLQTAHEMAELFDFRDIQQLLSKHERLSRYRSAQTRYQQFSQVMGDTDAYTH